MIAIGLEQVGDRFDPGGPPGASGTREIEFRAARAGTHDLRLKRWREWEGDTSVVDRFAVKVRVS